MKKPLRLRIYKYDRLGRQRSIFECDSRKDNFQKFRSMGRNYNYASHREFHHYERVNNFKPGDTVYLITNRVNNNTVKIVKTKIVDIHQFNNYRYLVNNKTSEYWFDYDIVQTTGLPVQNVFRTYNEAKFYMFRW